jgi:hypothetical protein
MQAKAWQWGQDDFTNPMLWRKVRTLAVDYVEPVIRLAKIPLAFAPGGLDKVADKLTGLTALFAADLNISALDGPEALKAIDGVPPPVTNEKGDGPVFFDGVEARLTVAHNGRGSEQILLERIDLHVITFVAGPDAYFSSSRDGEAIIGAGLMEPLRFYVEFGAEGVQPARRRVGGNKEPLIAQSANFLNTEPASFYAFSPNELAKMHFMLTALDAGYYETCLRFFYRVAARELRQYTSEPIRLYTDGG